MHMKKVTQKDRYGNQISYEFEVPEKPLDPTRIVEKKMELDQPDLSIAMMSMAPPPVMGEQFNMGDPNTHPGGPKGEDTVPAWLTPGEFVVNKEATDMFGPEIEAMNEVGRMAQGGKIDQVVMQGDGVPPHMLNEGGGIRKYIPSTSDVWKAAADAAKVDPRGASEFLPSMGNWMTTAHDLMPYLGVFGFNEGGRIDELNNLTQSMGWGRPLRHGEGAEVMEERARIMGEALDQAPAAQEELYRWYNPMTWGYNEGGAIPTPMPYDEALIQAREGYRDQVYEDSLGKPTVGYGTHVPGMQIGSTPYTQAENRANMQNDVANARRAAEAYVGPEVWATLDRRQQGALTSQAYQLGAAGQAEFVDMQAALQAGDPAAVRAAAEDSLWASQTPTRVEDLTSAFADGSMEEEKPWWQFWNEGGQVESPFIAGPLMYPPQYRFSGGWMDESWGGGDEVEGFDIPYGWNIDENRPYTKEEAIAAGTIAPDVPPPSSLPVPITDADLQQAEVWERQYADRDPDDLGNAETATPEETGGVMDWIGDNVLGPKGRELTGNYGTGTVPFQGGAGAFGVQNEMEGVTDPAYMEYYKRALGAGVIPDDYETYLADRVEGVTGESAIDRFAGAGALGGISEEQEAELAAQDAAAEVIAEGGDTVEAEAAAEEAAAEVTGETVETETETTKPVEEQKGDVIGQIVSDTQGAADDDTANGQGTDLSGTTGDDAATANEQKKAEDPNWTQKVEATLKNTLGDEIGGALGSLFDAGELAKMMVFVGGSLALGATPMQALNFGMKQYLGGLDKKTQAAAKRNQQAIQILGLNKFTPASVEEWKRTGDMNSLKPLAPAAAKPGKITGMKVMVPGHGLAQVWETGDGLQYVRGPNGQKVSLDLLAANGQTPRVYDAATMGEQAVKEEYGNWISNEVGKLNAGIEAGEEGYVSVNKTDLSSQANQAFQKLIRDSRLPNNDAEYVKSNIGKAMNDYLAAKKAFANGDLEKDPQSLQPFIDARMMSGITGVSPRMLEGVSMEQQYKLNSRIKNEMRADGLKDSQLDTAYSKFWQAGQAAWATVPPEVRKKYDGLATSGENGFTVFLTKLINDDQEALSYYSSLSQ